MPNVEVQLLGSPVVRAAGRELRFRTRKTLALLAVLIATPGAHRREALATLLWSDLELDAARREFRKNLSYLTATLGARAGLLVTTRETVELRRDLLTSDLDELTAAARLGTAFGQARLEAALRAYRGEFMLGFESGEAAFVEWLRGQRETCRGALGVVAGALICAQTATEQGTRSAAESVAKSVRSAETWVRLDAASEAAHRALMETQLAAGNPTAALEAFNHCRAALARELEASPGAQTRLVASRARAALGFSAPAGLVGRVEAWNALERASLQSGLCLICGEPGIGKSRLALEFAGAHGEALVMWAGETATGAPLAAVALTLRSSLKDPARRARLEALDPVWRAEVARLVPEFGVDTTDPAPTLEGRTRLLEGLLRALSAALGSQGVLVLDDLHSFDADSAELALMLTRRRGGITIACARSPELEANAAVKLALERFERHGTVTYLALGALSALEIAELLGARVAACRVDAPYLHRISGGNPLYALEAARHADPLAGQRGVTELLRGRVRRLGEPVQRLLEAASLCGEFFDFGAARRAAELPESQALAALELALEAELVVDWASGQRFSHGLIREALVEGLSAERQRHLHRRLASETVESNRIAQHLELGGRPGEAIAHRLRAAADATRLHAYRLALTHQDRALGDGLDDVGFSQIFEARYRLFVALADWVNLESELHRFAAAAARLGEPNLIAFVEMGWTDFCFRVGRYALGIDRATRLLRQPLARPVEAMTRYARALSLLSLGRHTEAQRDCMDALDCAPEDWDMRGWAFNTLAICQSAIGAFSEALSANELSQHWFQIRGDRHGVSSAQRVTAPILAHYGHITEALALLEVALSTTQQIGQVFLERAVLETMVKLQLGRFEDAANAGVGHDPDDFFRGVSREDTRRALPWLERCLERSQEPIDGFLEPLWRGRVSRARWLLSEEISRPKLPVARA